MADQTTLQAIVRNEFGKGASRRLRRDNRIPVVIYGHGEDPLHVHVDILEFQAILRNEGANAVLNLEIDGEKQLVMIKAVDQNVLTLNVDHADLVFVKRGEKVEVDIPVTFHGEAAPGAQVLQDADVITIEADVLDIPEEISVDVEGMEIGTQVLARDLAVPSNASLVSDPETLVINVVEPVEEELPEPGEEGEVDPVTGEALESDSSSSEESSESEDAEGEDADKDE